MEPALMSVCKDIRIGKILIQTNYETEEPEVMARLACLPVVHISSLSFSSILICSPSVCRPSHSEILTNPSLFLFSLVSHLLS